MPHEPGSDSFIHFISGVPVMLEGCTLSQDENQPGVYLHWRSLDNRPLKSLRFTLSAYDDADLQAFSSHQYPERTAPQGGCMGEKILIPLDIEEPRLFRVELHEAIFFDGEPWQSQEGAVFSIGIKEKQDDHKKGVPAVEKQKQQGKQENKEKKSVLSKRLAAVLLLLLLVAVAGVTLLLVMPEKNYQQALDLAAQGKYDAASQAFAKLGDYKDAPEMVLGVYAMEGEALLAQGDREGALAAFQKAGDDEDIAQRIDAIQYQNAQSLLNQGQMEQAYILFSSISHYEDALEQARQIRIAQAAQAMAEQDFAAAAQLLESIGQEADNAIYQQASAWMETDQPDLAAAAFRYVIDYSDSRHQLYRCAQAAAEKKDYVLAIALFTELSDYEDSALRLKAVRYAQAEEWLNLGEYEAAAQQFEALADYADAALRVSDARYAAAGKLLANGQFREAKTAFLALSGYGDSALMAQEADYRAAQAAFEQGDYDQAIAFFEAAGEYKDSADRILAARLAGAKVKLEAGDYLAAIQALVALKDYQNSQALLPQAYYGYAQQLSAQGELEKAYETFLLAGEYSDAALQAQEHAFAQGFSLQQQGRYAEALSWYDRCPRHAEVPQQKFLLAEAFLMQQQYEQALPLLKEVSHLPGAGEYLYQIAQNATEKKDYATAYTAFVYAGEYQDSPQKAAALMEDMKLQASALLAQGQYAQADMIFETLARGGFVTAESQQAEFFAFLTAPGRRFTMGNYPQTAEGSMIPVLWRVLDWEEGTMTLLSDALLGCARYDSYSVLSVEQYLKTLSIMFQAGERQLAGDLNILTQQEVMQYLPADRDRVAAPTEYAKARAVEEITYRTEGVWTSTASDNFNYVIYDHSTGKFIQKSLQFKTNYVRPAMQLKLDQSLYQLLSNPDNGYQFFDENGKKEEFISRYQ